MRRVNILLFGLPGVVLLLLPLLCLIAWYSLSDCFDFTLFLLAIVIFWVEIPAMIFGTPFFEHGPSPADIGYYPNGFLGWLVLIVFYALASLAISLVIMYAMKRRHLTNR
jgi:hypothetical protein